MFKIKDKQMSKTYYEFVKYVCKKLKKNFYYYFKCNTY